jgi:hypothetical protein
VKRVKKSLLGLFPSKMSILSLFEPRLITENVSSIAAYGPPVSGDRSLFENEKKKNTRRVNKNERKRKRAQPGARLISVVFQQFEAVCWGRENVIALGERACNSQQQQHHRTRKELWLHSWVEEEKNSEKHLWSVAVKPPFLLFPPLPSTCLDPSSPLPSSTCSLFQKSLLHRHSLLFILSFFFFFFFRFDLIFISHEWREASQ